MRYTEKNLDFCYVASATNIVEILDLIEGHKYAGTIITKLGILEDAEEKLDIDLLELLSDGEFQGLMYSYAHNVPFVFAPRKEEKK